MLCSNMRKAQFIFVVFLCKLIVNSILAGNWTSAGNWTLAGQPCNKINEIIDDKEDCAIYFTCNIDETWSRESCSFPLLFSETEKRCEHFVNVSCGVRFEPRSPCMYTGGSNDGCSYIPERTICQCVNTMDLNFNMCVGLPDGFYTWPSRKLSKYYIHCLVGRTLPMECEGSSVVFDIQERRCSLVYDKVSKMYNNTVPLADSVLVPEPSLYVDAAETQFVQDISVPLQQTKPGLFFNLLTSFSRTIYAVLTGGDVTKTNLVPNESLLIQQPSSFVVTSAKTLQHEASLTVLQSSKAGSAQAINADMTVTQFVPNRYTLLQLRDSTIILKPSSDLVFDIFKSTSEIDPSGVSSYVTNYKPASAFEALFPISNTLTQSFFFRIASFYTSIYMRNRYSIDNVRTTPNRMTQNLTSTGKVTASSLNFPLKHNCFADSSTWNLNSENRADLSLFEAVRTPFIDQNEESISSEISELNTINYETHLSVGQISEPEIIFPSDFERNSIAVNKYFFEPQNTSYPSSEIWGHIKAKFLELPHETYYQSKYLSYSDLRWSLNEAYTRHVLYLKLSEQIQGDFDIIPSKIIQLSYTSANDPLSAANTNTYFTTTHSEEIDDNPFILTRTFLTTTETDLDQMSLRYPSRMHILSSEAIANSGISRPDDLDLFMPSDLTDIEIGLLASNTGYQYGLSNMISIRLSDTELRVSNQFRSKHSSQLPKSSNRNIFSISTNTSTIITPSKILTSQMNLLPWVIFESTLPATDDQSSIIREVSNQELGILEMKATSDENMESKMAGGFHTKHLFDGVSSLDQFGYSSLKFSPKFEHPKTTISKMNLVAKFISAISMPIKITDYIQPTMAQPASKSAPLSLKPTEGSKQKLNTDKAKKASSEPLILPSKTMLKLSELMTSELIQSSLIPVTLKTFQALLQESGTPAMDTYSLLGISETLYSAMILQHSSSQAVTFETGGPSNGLILKSSPESMTFTYDSQLSPSKTLQRESPFEAIALSSSIVSTSNSWIKVKSNASCVNTLTDMISSSVKDTSNFQSTESKQSNRTDNSTKLILLTKNEKYNPLNLTNTSFLAALVCSCAGFVIIFILTTILIICLRKRKEDNQELQTG